MGALDSGTGSHFSSPPGQIKSRGKGHLLKSHYIYLKLSPFWWPSEHATRLSLCQDCSERCVWKRRSRRGFHWWLVSAGYEDGGGMSCHFVSLSIRKNTIQTTDTVYPWAWWILVHSFIACSIPYQAPWDYFHWFYWRLDQTQILKITHLSKSPVFKEPVKLSN